MCIQRSMYYYIYDKCFPLQTTIAVRYEAVEVDAYYNHAPRTVLIYYVW